ncbi:MAG TPA: hypothetical protein VH765_06215 [Xanthobacteraceae bacterium]|jgi:hypothetical protein
MEILAQIRLPALAGGFVLALLTFPAAADAIDGNWCSPKGRTLSIRGPQIVTPGGNTIEGKYDRHYFSYTIPAAEPGSGRTVNMTLLGENTVRIEADAANGAPMEIWNRCGPSVSEVSRQAADG